MSSNALAVLFVHLYRSIGRDITSTYTKLEKLTLMAKKKTIFDDNRVAVQKLTNVIKQDIAHLNKQIGQLQTIAKYCNHSNTSSNSLIVSGLKERVKGSNRQAILPAFWSNFNPNLQQCPTISSRCTKLCFEGWNLEDALVGAGCQN